MKTIKIIGAGLAGSEAASFLAKKGHNIELYEMKPFKFTKAHSYKGFGELVCSNSLKAIDIKSASGLLKAELRLLGSTIMEAADKNKVDAGGAFAVDREGFSDYITQKIMSFPNINVINSEIEDLNEINKEDYVIISTGPLTTPKLARAISKLTGKEYLHFFDAAAPIISGDSIDFNIAFKASRYNKGTADYVNCPMTKDQYDVFYNELINTEKVEFNNIDKKSFFEGCMPIEELAGRGYMTPLFGPMKPVGIIDPSFPEKKYHAIVQLRKENREGSMYNLVGFQTRLKFEEQKRIFKMIPGMESAVFLRYGVMHRNTYLNSPKLLDKYYRLRSNMMMFFAGQLTGVEGYLESTASGLYAALQMDRIINGMEPYDFTRKTCIGALANHISDETINNFQPMNANFGIMAAANGYKMTKQQKKEVRVKTALDFYKVYLKNLNLDLLNNK